jgi:hypothetical protein
VFVVDVGGSAAVAIDGGYKSSWDQALRVAPDGSVIAAPMRDEGLVNVYDGRTMALLRSIHCGEMFGPLVFSPDSSTLLIAHRDGCVTLWRVADASLIRELWGHSDYVNTPAFSHSSRLFATPSDDATIKLWRMSDGAKLRTLTGHTSYVKQVAFTPDDAQLVSISFDASMRVWRVADGALLRVVALPSKALSLCVAADGRSVFTGCEKGELQQWRLSDGRELRRMPGHSFAVNDMCLLRGGAVLVSGSSDSTVRFWRVADGALLRTVTLEAAVLAVAALP